MCSKRNGEAEDPCVITKFLEPNELVQTVRGWIPAREWLEKLQRKDFRNCPTEIVTAGRSQRIALRRCDLSEGEVVHG